MEVLKEWLGLFALVISIGSAGYAWLTAGSKANAKKLELLDARDIDHDRRIQALESQVAQMPSKDAVHHLDLKVSDLTGSVKVVVQSLQAVERTAHRIEEFLLSQAKK